ncbi:MAG: hypothetical protein ACE5I5_18755 [Candidatus Heimdallarchaeota archaeon]
MKALKTELKRWKSMVPKKFFLIFPLNIEYETLNGTRHFIVDKMKLKTRSFAHAKTNYDFKTPHMILRHDKEIRKNINDFTYVIVETSGKNQNDAFNSANKRVELFRSLLNFDLSFGMITWQIGRPRPLTRIERSKYIFVFQENRRYLGYWGNVGEFRYQLVKLTKNQIIAIKKNIKDFEKLERNKLKNILVECLNLYGYALDQIERGYTFLNLWQILELIALKDASGIKLDKVKSRIKAIFKGKQIISDVLDVLFCKRNDLVHEGRISDFSLQDVNQIKGITEACIDFLWSHVNKMGNTDGLNNFYENIGLTKKKLDKKIAVLNYIKKVKP